jgi:hypothetical protein
VRRPLSESGTIVTDAAISDASLPVIGAGGAHYVLQPGALDRPIHRASTG